MTTLSVTAEQMAAYEAQVAAEEAGTELPSHEPTVEEALTAAFESVVEALEALKYAVLHSGLDVDDYDPDDPEVTEEQKAMMTAGTYLMGAFQGLLLLTLMAAVHAADE